MFRIGIIGAAKIAHKFVKSAERLPEVKIASAASKSSERAEIFAAKMHIPAFYGSYEEMLQKEPLDAVYIATTINYHYENTLLALKYHIPVLCEKALTDTEEHAREMFRYSEKQRTFLMEGTWTLFTPKTQKVREWISEGRIGTPNLIQGNIGFAPKKDPNSRYFSHELGGGAMLDLGAYMVQVPPYMVGQKIVSYDGWTIRGFNGIDEKICLSMRLEQAVCNMIGSLDSALPEECLIAGERGFIRIPRFHMGNQAYLFDPQGNLLETFDDPDSVGFEYEIKEMISCVRSGKIYSEAAAPERSIECAEISDWVRNQYR